MRKYWFARVLALALYGLASTTALAATMYDFSSNKPTCSGGSWSVNGTTHTCSGSIALVNGDSIVPSSSITVVASAGISLDGNNTIGSTSKTVDLETAWGSISIAGTGNAVYGSLKVGSGSISVAGASVSGNVTTTSGSLTISDSTVSGTVTASSGAITLTRVALTGNIASGTGGVTLSGPSTVVGSIAIGGPLSITGGSVSGNVSAGNGVMMLGATDFGGNVTSTGGPVSLAGGKVKGSVAGHNGVTTTGGTVISGDVKASNGPISLSGGSVGTVYSDCCALTTNGTDIKGDINAKIGSSRDTVSITGGTISGAISTSGGNGISITKATVTSGSITTTNVPIVISDSKIGTPSSQVNVINNGNQSIAIKGTSVVYGDVETGGTLTIDTTSKVYGNCSFQSITGQCSPFVPGPDHIRVFFNDNTGALTCSPRLLDAIACTNSNCEARYASPVSVTLSPGGTAATIPAGDIGKPSVARTTVGVATVTLAASDPATALRCYSGSVDSPGDLVSPCNLTFSAAGFFVSVPDHKSCTTQTLTITAAKTDDKTKTCVPAFGNNVLRNIKLRFAYANPASGASPAVVPRVDAADPPATALSTTTDASLTMTFSKGVATTNLRYNDAGSLSVSASYAGSAATGDADLNMGTVAASAFVVAPASFALSGIPAAPLTAGEKFNVTVTARNSCGATTANFGREKPAATALLTSSHPLPGMGNATEIKQTLSGFKKGEASTKLTWNEVGTFDLTATTSAYLGSDLKVVGSQTAVGRFQPAYFDTIVTPGCSGAFSYAGLSGAPSLAGQPFTVEVRAKRAGGGSSDATNTANYEKNAVDPAVIWSKDVTLADANDAGGTIGKLTNGTFAADRFSAGKAIRGDVNYALASKLTAPYTLAIRASETDNPMITSSGHTEGKTLMRSGRLRLFNAYGPEKATLSLLVQAQYWSGSSWVQNSADTCTRLPKESFALSDPNGVESTCSGVSGTVSLASGQGDLVLNKPTGACSIDIAANLGASGNDQSCLTRHGGEAAKLPWLRSRNGSCASTYDRDPSARASFGIYSPETKKTVHVRELY